MVFIALLVSRVLFDFFFNLFFLKKTLPAIVLLSSCIGVAISTQQILPFSFDIALVVIPFQYFGYCWKYVKNWKLTQLQKICGVILCFMLWIVLAEYACGELAISARIYPIFPLCWIAALAASIVFLLFTRLLEKAKIFLPLQFLGRHCIYFYFVHCIDYTYPEWYNVMDKLLLNFLIRIVRALI